MSDSLQPPARIRRVLSIDGGGIRGIIPAMVIAHIENSLANPPTSCST
jgi:patatin-like phospholipase/acyl hydrolase